MKLYATTTSERAKKGQGGNKYIEVIINDEQKENICQVLVEYREEEIYVEFTNYSSGEKYIFSKAK